MKRLLLIEAAREFLVQCGLLPLPRRPLWILGYHVLHLPVWNSLMLCSKNTLVVLCVEMAMYGMAVKLTGLKVGPRFEPMVSLLL